MVPQIGTHQSLTLPNDLPDHPYLKALQPLGWMHTQPTETNQLSPQDIMYTSKLVSDNSDWDPDTCGVVTVSFTPGSCSLGA